MNQEPNEWATCLRISETPAVDELLRAFAEGETSEDTAVMIVREVRRAVLAHVTKLPDDVEIRVMFEEAVNASLMNYPLGIMEVNDAFHCYMDPDTNNLWLGYKTGVKKGGQLNTARALSKQVVQLMFDLEALEAEQEVSTFDLTYAGWEAILAAAEKSPWIPPQYMQNDWVADVCTFLSEVRPSLLASVNVEAVGQVTQRADGPEIDWFIEGGIHAIPENVVLCITDRQVTDDTGHGVVYQAPPLTPADVPTTGVASINTKGKADNWPAEGAST